MPNLVPAVGSAILWIWIFNPEFGLLNTALASIGIKGPLWLAHSKWALPALIIMSLWGVGGGMLIYLAGLQGIPTDLYEAAEIDGAGTLAALPARHRAADDPGDLLQPDHEHHRHLPGLHRRLRHDRRRPAQRHLFYVLYLYNNAFQYFQMGYASALAWVLFVIILFFTLLVFRSSSAWVYYEGELQGEEVAHGADRYHQRRQRTGAHARRPSLFGRRSVQQLHRPGGHLRPAASAARRSCCCPWSGCSPARSSRPG